MRWDKLTPHKSLGGLGFRNMEAFNLSMLGKQSWKLITDSNSLLTCVLKAKYFPRQDFMDAPLGHNPSYTWRSLWSTQSLLTLGLRWKIGDGTKTNVWSMPWIRNLPTHKPDTLPPPHLEDLTMNHLMNPDLLSWNHNLVNSLFTSQVAVVVISTPLFTRSMEDTRIWKVSPDGNYTVKSAYRICVELLHPPPPAQTDLHWKNLWNFKIPPRVSSFMWRLAYQCLPTRVNLATQGIPCDDTCVSCETLVESHMHIFFVCSKEMECWDRIDLGNHVRELLLQTSEFTTLLFDFLDRLSLIQQ